MGNRITNLKDKIDNCAAVSFSVFDCALSPLLLIQSDILQLCAYKCQEGLDFPKRRIKAEIQTRLNAAKKGVVKTGEYKPNARSEREVRIKEVYSTYARTFGITEERCRELMENEIQARKNSYARNDFVFALYEYAKASGKKVYFCEDSILDKSDIEEVLHKNGYGIYNEIYVSSDELKTKAEGRLFKQMIKDSELDAQQILHLGPSQRSDIAEAQALNIQTHLTESNAQRIKRFRIGKLFYNKLIKQSSSLLLSASAAYLLNEAVTKSFDIDMFVSKLFLTPFLFFNAEFGCRKANHFKRLLKEGLAQNKNNQQLQNFEKYLRGFEKVINHLEIKESEGIRHFENLYNKFVSKVGKGELRTLSFICAENGKPMINKDCFEDCGILKAKNAYLNSLWKDGATAALKMNGNILTKVWANVVLCLNADYKS